MLNDSVSMNQKRRISSMGIYNRLLKGFAINIPIDGFYATIVIQIDLAIIVAAIVVLCMTQTEQPSNPLRLLICVQVVLGVYHLIPVVTAFCKGESEIVLAYTPVSNLLTVLWWFIGIAWISIVSPNAPCLHGFAVVLSVLRAVCFILQYCVVPYVYIPADSPPLLPLQQFAHWTKSCASS